jgi:hypothetical protein
VSSANTCDVLFGVVMPKDQPKNSAQVTAAQLTQVQFSTSFRLQPQYYWSSFRRETETGQLHSRYGLDTLFSADLDSCAV